MPETPAFLAERLKTEGAKTANFFTSLTDAQWQADIYTEGTTWSARNVLAHFVMAEKSFIRLFANVRGGGPGVPEDFNINTYNANQQEKAGELSPQELLEQFTTVRAKMVAWVEGLDPGDLKKHGRHPFLGMTTLAEMIKMIYLHNQTHLRDVRRSIGLSQPTTSSE